MSVAATLRVGALQQNGPGATLGAPASCAVLLILSLLLMGAGLVLMARAVRA